MNARTRQRWVGVVRTPLGLTATALTLGVLVMAVIAPILWTDNANAVDIDNILAGPSAQHWAGTDNLGRDILYRVLVATRLSVGLALTATAIAVVVGLVLGATPFLVGRRLARLVTASVNVAVAFPGLLLALFFAVIFGIGAKGAVLAIGLAGAPGFARLTHTLVCERLRAGLRGRRTRGRRRSVPQPDQARAAQHRRAVGRQRDDGRWGGAACLLGPVVPRSRGAAAQLRLGPAAFRRRRGHLREPCGGTRARGRRGGRGTRVQPLR